MYFTPGKTREKNEKLFHLISRKLGNQGGISRNLWEIGGTRGKFRGNSGEIRGKLGNCVSLGKQNSLAGKSIFPTSGKKGENEGKLFHKNSHLGNLCETGGENEREMKENFVFTTSLNCTVL